MMKKYRRRRFSLIELVVVVGVLLILAALLLPVLRRARQRARFTRWMTYKRDLRYHDNLIVYYTFEDGGGSKLENQATAPEGFRHFDPERYNGTLTGNPSWETGRWTRKQAIRFAANADHIACGTFDIDKDHTPVDGMSILASFQLNDLENSDTRIIGKSTGSGANEHIFMLGTTKQGGEVRLRAMVRTDAGATVELIAGSGNIEEKSWVHAAVTYDGSRVILYHNGVEVASKDLTGKVATNPSATVTIGGLANGDESFIGLIDEIAIFNTGLSSSEVNEHYTVGIP